MRELGSLAAWGLLCQWGLAAAGRGHLKIGGASLSAPQHGLEGASSAAFWFLSYQVSESARQALWKCRRKSLLTGKTWLANCTLSEAKQIWETPECSSYRDGPELRSSSERLGEPSQGQLGPALGLGLWVSVFVLCVNMWLSGVLLLISVKI